MVGLRLIKPRVQVLTCSKLFGHRLRPENDRALPCALNAYEDIEKVEKAKFFLVHRNIHALLQ